MCAQHSTCSLHVKFLQAHDALAHVPLHSGSVHIHAFAVCRNLVKSLWTTLRCSDAVPCTCAPNAVVAKHINPNPSATQKARCISTWRKGSRFVRANTHVTTLLIACHALAYDPTTCTCHAHMLCRVRKCCRWSQYQLTARCEHMPQDSPTIMGTLYNTIYRHNSRHLEK